MRFLRLFFITILCCGQPPKEKAQSILIRGLNDTSVKVQVSAAGALARLNNKEGYQKLVELLGSDDTEIAALAITKLALIPDTLNGKLLRPFLIHKSPLLRRLSIEAMAEIGIVEPKIVKMLDEKSIPIVVASTKYIGQMKIIQAKSKLNRLITRKEPEIRIAAKIALGRRGDKRAANLIKSEMSEKSPTVWEEAIKGLGIVGDTSSIDYFKEIADGDIWPLKIAAIEALMRMGVRKDEVLISALKSDDPMIRIRGISIVAELGDEKFLPHIIPLTEDPFLNTALQAIRFISRYHKPEVKEKLASLLDAENPHLKIAVAEAFLMISK